MNKALKRTLSVVLIIAAVIGGIWGGLTLLKSAKRQPVNVYSVSDFSTLDYNSSSVESSGLVTTDKLQKIYISDTQSVRLVYVTEGQTVKKGDLLLSYDSTLDDLGLKRAELALEQQALELEKDQKEVDDLKIRKSLGKLENERDEYAGDLFDAEAASRGTATNVNLPYIPTTQTGEQEHPYYVLCNGALPLGSMTDLDDGKYYVFYTMDGTTPIAVQGIFCTGADLELFDAAMPIGADPADSNSHVSYLRRVVTGYDEEIASALTRSELNKLIAQKERELETSKINYKLAELDLAAKKKEAGSNMVYAEIDGVVKTVRPAEEAFQSGNAVVEISGGGGYYITGAVSEMMLDSISIGQSVDVNSWQSGGYWQGEVVSVENYPTNDTGWSNGNPNVSWYPFKVFVTEDASLQPNEYVQLSYQPESDGDSGWFLENMFIRTENGKRYVMIRGESGLLEKCWIQTGRDLWGSYTEIRGGLTQDDYVAFPYGQDTVEGAKTQEATVDQLYNY